MRPTELIAEAHSSHSSAFARRLLVTQKLPPRNLYESIGILSLRFLFSFFLPQLLCPETFLPRTARIAEVRRRRQFSTPISILC